MSVDTTWLGPGKRVREGTTCLTCPNKDGLSTRKRQARCTCRERALATMSMMSAEDAEGPCWQSDMDMDMDMTWTSINVGLRPRVAV
jgi:hypothetical protein